MNKLSPALEGSKSVDLYPLILRRDNSNFSENESHTILRLRGGGGEDEKEG
jgi:hypothetical protein